MTAAVAQQKRAKAPSSRKPAFLRSPELETALACVAAQLPDVAGMDADAVQAVTRQVVRSEIGFISNPRFSEPGIGSKIFDSQLDLQFDAKSSKSFRQPLGIDLPVQLGRLCEAPLLTPDQERMLFERMNFLLQLAAMHRSYLNVERPSRSRLYLVQMLIALAEWHRDRIVEANLRLVFSIVKKFVNSANQFEELLSDGIVALIRAVEKFDFDRGFRFSTYATQVIRRNSYRTVVEKQQERQKVMGGFQEMEIDICEDRVSGISEQRWHELRGHLTLMLDALDRREKLIIRSRFALGSHRKVRTLQALADRLGISKERVRQLERRALEKLSAMADNIELQELTPIDDE